MCVFSVVVAALIIFFLLLTDSVPYAPLRLTPLHFGYGSCSALTHIHSFPFFFLNFFSKCAHWFNDTCPTSISALVRIFPSRFSYFFPSFFETNHGGIYVARIFSVSSCFFKNVRCRVFNSWCSFSLFFLFVNTHSSQTCYIWTLFIYFSKRNNLFTNKLYTRLLINHTFYYYY